MRLTPRCKAWIESSAGFVLGPGGLAILESIKRTGSIRAASQELGMSYKFVWSYVRRLEEDLEIRVVETRRGGYRHGGTSLTPCAERLVETYKNLSAAAEEVCRKYKRLLEELWGECHGPGESSVQDSRRGKREG